MGRAQAKKEERMEVILAVGLRSRFLSNAFQIFGHDLCVLSNYRLPCQALSALCVRMFPAYECVHSMLSVCKSWPLTIDL